MISRGRPGTPRREFEGRLVQNCHLSFLKLFPTWLTALVLLFSATALVLLLSATALVLLAPPPGDRAGAPPLGDRASPALYPAVESASTGLALQLQRVAGL